MEQGGFLSTCFTIISLMCIEMRYITKDYGSSSFSVGKKPKINEWSNFTNGKKPHDSSFHASIKLGKKQFPNYDENNHPY